MALPYPRTSRHSHPAYQDIYPRQRPFCADKLIVPDVEQPDKEYPLILITGRSLFHYHTGTMTHKVAGLMKYYPEERVEISPADAAALGIADKEMVSISSRRGNVTCRAKVTSDSPDGSVYMNFHFTEVPTNCPDQ